VSDASSDYCDIAASCLCGGKYVQNGNVPADGVLEATITYAYEAQITATFGNVGSFAVGDTICVDQSVVGATILVPVKNGGDAAQVVPPPPDGGTCVPNFAFNVMLDDGGRPLSCNAGNESQLSMTTQQAIDALMASDCTAQLAKNDSRWAENACAPSGGCQTSATTPGMGALFALVFVAWISFRRFRSRGSRGRRDAT
jgi:hypothetical protein